jgi:hypothetical protein
MMREREWYPAGGLHRQRTWAAEWCLTIALVAWVWLTYLFMPN